MTNHPESPRSARLNMRVSPEALEQLRAAADLQQQDLTAFVLGAALEKARAVLIDDQVLHLTAADVTQLERALDRAPQVNDQLLRRLRRAQHGVDPVPSTVDLEA